MGTIWLIGAIAAIAVVGYLIGRLRATAFARAGGQKVHSRPGYHGAHVLIAALLPALAVLVVLLVARPFLLSAVIRGEFPEEISANAAQAGLTEGVVRQVATGLTLLNEREADQLRLGFVAIRPLLASKGVALGGDVAPFMVDAAKNFNAWSGIFDAATWVLGLVVALLGALVGLRQVAPAFRARTVVEGVIRWLLIAASGIAILTTFGIVMSLLWESLVFFGQVSPLGFFFGTVWDPRFSAAGGGGEGGQFGLIPLLWGTLYVSLIAMIIAVPIGLFSAIYMSEYATKTVRTFAKPLIEVLAGIPTIVYGFFALATVGPFIRDWFAIPLGVGNSGSSVMTAGVVMGIMIIPFVSSLSDDIINAVPQAMRDGSLGLGATKSETIRQVVLPAALPGIVGAVLLAASRAIGETMIVVLAAGVATRISLNPFQEMTTMTVKIVSQLTGDTEFTSPQTLVAFALGLTLFVITLIMNIYALHIVRKYREQYE